MVELSPLRQLRMGHLPKMVSWYDPRLLARIGVRTIVSSVFGQYADQRLMQAVTDPAEDKDLAARYDYRDLDAGDPNKCVACDETGVYTCTSSDETDPVPSRAATSSPPTTFAVAPPTAAVISPGSPTFFVPIRSPSSVEYSRTPVSE